MFGNVVMSVEHHCFEHELDAVKRSRGYTLDTELNEDDLKEVVSRYMKMVKRVKGCDFPTDAMTQLKLGIDAVFGSGTTRAPSNTAL
jgi:pyruvate,orthophosphate dikinase